MKTNDDPALVNASPQAAPPVERQLRGLGVATGIAIGPAYVIDTGAVAVPEYCLPADLIQGERDRFAAAAEKARRQIAKLKSRAATLPESAAEEVSFLLDAHLAMLSGSRLTRGVDARIERDRINAEAAVQAEIAAIARTFAGMDDAYLAARIGDIREVGTRLIRILQQHHYQAFSMLPEGCIVVAEELSPADTALMDPGRVAGFATVLGGAEGHTAIMARSLGLPAVLGISALLAGVRTGDLMIVDGITGRVVVNPGAETLLAYQRCREEIARDREQLKELRQLPAVSKDRVMATLSANLELPRDITHALAAGAAGIGLLRTEFLFMNRDDLPDEEEQYRVLRQIVEGMEGRPVTARTLDLGGEKLVSALGRHFGDCANPALGLRAIRLGLKEPSLLETQLRAMLRAAVHGPMRILLPMITTRGEVCRVREMLHQVAQRLQADGVTLPDPLPPLGIMIEVPGAALSADQLAGLCDFFAIGTNDLTQYTLAIDRGDEAVAALYDPLHPAVLRLIQFTVQSALRAQIPVSVCGEIAGDPRYAALLLGLGVRELSMAPARIPGVKRRIRDLDVAAATGCAEKIMMQADGAAIAAILDNFNARA
ncbi:MAG: phosphoenolpyruvate--protein phosphotransferase [Azospirillaceae bacterium]|nr:phosphoenolpyruvate--protein phosphotransferase [Azospirillaceae bacterium]